MYVEYHSYLWQVLVESGWTTWSVDSHNIAHMIKVRRVMP